LSRNALSLFGFPMREFNQQQTDRKQEQRMESPPSPRETVVRRLCQSLKVCYNTKNDETTKRRKKKKKKEERQRRRVVECLFR